MLLRQMQYFQAVVENKSFSDAAEACHISQSAISQQIKALEEELDVRLLERHNRTFSLTPAGEHFYKKGLVITADLERLTKETRRIAHGGDEVLAIGYLKAYSGSEFLDAVAAFSRQYPDVQLKILTGNHEELYHLLLSREVDMILSDQRRKFNEAYMNLELAQVQCYVEIAMHDPVARLDVIEPGDLQNMTCILVAGPDQQEIEREYYYNSVGFHGDFLFVESLREGRLLVAAGRGFMPVEGIREDVYYDASIRRIPLMNRRMPIRRNYCAFWDPEHAGYYVEEFAKILQKEFEQA